MDKLKEYLLTQSGFYTALFCLLAITAWFANGWLGKHFSITDLSTIYGIVIAHVTAKYAVASKWNTPQGDDPEKRKGDISK